MDKDKSPKQPIKKEPIKKQFQRSNSIDPTPDIIEKPRVPTKPSDLTVSAINEKTNRNKK